MENVRVSSIGKIYLVYMLATICICVFLYKYYVCIHEQFKIPPQVFFSPRLEHLPKKVRKSLEFEQKPHTFVYNL